MLQAQSYERDGQDQDAYLFYMRHAILASEKLTKHPDYKTAESAVARKKLNKDVVRDMDIMETLRPRINEKFERYTQAIARRNVEREKWAQEHPSQAALARDMGTMSLQDTGRRKERLELHAGKGENNALALSLANKELRKRQGGRRSERTQGLLPAEDDTGGEDLAQRIMATARRSEQAQRERNGIPQHENSSRRVQTHQAYNYPSVPSKKGITDNLPSYTDSQQPSAPARPPKKHFLDSAPVLPPKEREIPSQLSTHAPPVPQKLANISPPSRSSTTTPDISTKDYTFLATALTESGKPLRTLFINPTLRSEFLKIAAPNTLANLETCGILCGTLISNAFFISKLVIPQQTATSDTCDTINETLLFDYVDSHDLMTLGWIHTHPSQTCFMSSRDLHTHGGYQVQMAESIAIVCAPKHEPSHGVFRLTDPPGLKAILECRRDGVFHQHEDVRGGIYTDAMRPGHVQELGGLGFEVVDLRE